MITGISTVSVYVDNQQESLKFWTEKMGFEVRANNSMGPQGSWIELAPKGAQSAIVIYPKSMMQNWKEMKPSILFVCDDIERTFRDLASKGGQVHSGAKKDGLGDVRNVHRHGRKRIRNERRILMPSYLPSRFHTITPSIAVRNAPKAIEFYKDVFGATENFRNYMPGTENTIMHAELTIGDSVIMLSEEFPDAQWLSPQTLRGTSAALYMYVPDADAAFDRAISAGCSQNMPLMDTFWGDRCGQVVDPFGHRWLIATHKRDLSNEEINRAGEAFFDDVTKKKGV